LQGNAGAASGFFQTGNPINFPSVASSWWHLLDVRYDNPTSNYAMQFAGSFFDQNFYCRKVNNNPAQPWSRILTENPDGTVGIGTFTPENAEHWQRVLDVHGDQYSKIMTTTGNVTTGLYSHSWGYYGAPAGGIVGTTTNHPFSIMTNKMSRVTVDVDGNVGIGTTTPEVELDVAGEMHSWATGIGGTDLYTSAKNWVNFGSNLHGTAIMSSNVYLNSDYSQKMFIVEDNSTVSGAAIIIPGNLQPYQNSILFYTNPVGAVTHDAPYNGNIAMMINSANSNVGIGTTSPTEKLSINGNVRAKKVIVTQAGWADYVFDPSYKLPSLDSISTFIKANKHLPEIPSAAAIEKDGQDVGEVQKLLLKKVEELTLYVIEQENNGKEMKRQNEELIQKNKQLEKRIQRLEQM
jgi:hypothetical protein